MSMNFGGLGFAFGAVDTGASKVAKGVATSVDAVWDGLQRIGPAAIDAGRQISNGFSSIKSATQHAIGGVGAAIAGMIESAQNPKLNAPYAEMFASFDKSFNRMTAGTKIVGKEARRMQRDLGSAAFSLNEDMDSAAEGVLAFKKQNVDLMEVLGSKGLKGSYKDLIRVQSVFEIQGQQLANVTSTLVHGFEFTEEKVGMLGDRIVAAGQQFNMGKEALQSWPAVMESINEAAADFGRKLSPDEIQKMTEGIYKLGFGLKESLGMDGASAIELARNSFATMMKERQSLLNMSRGKESQLGDFAMQILESTGDADEMFKLMNGDMAGFMDAMSRISKEAQKYGGTTGIAFQRLNAQINESLGDNVSYAVAGNWEKVAGKVASISDVMDDPKTKGAMARFAKEHHRTALTAQEGWDRMVAGFEGRLMKLSAPLRRKWVKDMGGGFNKTASVLENMVKIDPKTATEAEKTVSNLTQKLLLSRDVGLSAFLDKSSGFGAIVPLFENIVSGSLPVMTAIGSMGLRFSSLGKMALGGGALFMLFKMLKDGPEQAVKSMKDLGKTAWTFVTGLFPGLEKVGEKAVKVFDQFNSDRKQVGVVGALKNMVSGGRVEEVGNYLVGFIEKGFSYLRTVDWKGIGDVVVDLLGKGVSYAFSGANMLADWFSNIDFDSAFKWVGNKFRELDVPGLISKIVSFGKKGASGLGSMIQALVKNIRWDEIARVAVAGFTGFVDIAASFIKGLFGQKNLEKGVQKAGIGSALGHVITMALSAAKDVVIGASSQLWRYFIDSDSLSEAGGKLVKVAAGIFASLFVLSSKFRSKIATKVIGGLKEVGTRSVTTFKEMGRTLALESTNGSKKARMSFMSVGIAARGMAGKIKGAMKGLRKGFAIFGGVGLLFGLIESMDQIKERMKNIGDIATNKLIPDMQKIAMQGEQAFMGIMGTLDKVFLGLPSQIGNALGISSTSLSNFYYDMESGFEQAIAYVVAGFHNSMSSMELLWDNFVTTFTGGWDILKSSLNVAWEWMKSGWKKTVSHMEGALDTTFTQFELIFLKIRQGFETLFVGVTSNIAKAVNALPDFMKEKMGSNIAKWARENSRDDVMDRLQRRQAKERRSIEMGLDTRNEDRYRERNAASSAVKEAKQELQNTVSGVGREYEKNERRKQRRDQATANMLSHQIDSIQEEGKRTKEAAEQYRKEKEAAASDNQKSKGSMKSKGYGTGNGKYDVPTAAQQAAAKTTIALPSSMTSEIQAMTGNVTNLTRNMANFLKKPFNINVQIAGSNEFKRSLRATATLEGRGAQ